MLGYFLKWATFLGLWCLFVYQFSLFELLAGAGASALTLFAIEKARKYEPLRFAPRLVWIAQAWHLPGQIVKGVWLLFKAFSRRIASKPSLALFQLVAFEGVGDDPERAAQRALVVLYGTMPPDSVIVEFDPPSKMLMVHQLESAPVPAMIRKLEAR